MHQIYAILCKQNLWRIFSVDCWAQDYKRNCAMDWKVKLTDENKRNEGHVVWSIEDDYINDWFELLLSCISL